MASRLDDILKELSSLGAEKNLHLPDSCYQAFLYAEKEHRGGNLTGAAVLYKAVILSDIYLTLSAKAFRGLGEIAEANKDLPEAIRLFTVASCMDPKLGLDKKVKALQNALQGPSPRPADGRMAS